MKLYPVFLFSFIISFSAWAQMPHFKAVVHDKAAVAGYYFLAEPEHLMIFDSTGELIYYKTGRQLSNFMIQANGLMTYNENPVFFVMDSSFKVIDSVVCKNIPVTNYHDLRILHNHHYLLLGTDSTVADLTNYPNLKRIANGDKSSVLYNVIQELDEKKNVVFEWRAKDHYSLDDLDTFYEPRFHFIDWTHTDAVEQDRDGNILISNRNMNQITKINRSDGSVMWRLGGKRNEFQFINSPVPFYGQHDVRRIDNGDITLFDNGNGLKARSCRALEYELDEKNKIARLRWSYAIDSATYSTRNGNVQRMHDLTTVINFGNTAGNPKNHISFVVLDSSNHIIFHMEGINSYRVFNYRTLPWKLKRPQVARRDSAGVIYLDAGVGKSSYIWNTRDSTQTIPLKKAGIYYVFLPDGKGGYIRSETVTVKRHVENNKEGVRRKE